MLDFAWWEITGKCQLACDHCYASSGPEGTHGSLSVADWRRVITQTREAGARMGQFIGGEPTLHPALPQLVQHALSTDMEVEIYTNLVHVTPEMWETFRLPGSVWRPRTTPTGPTNTRRSPSGPRSESRPRTSPARKSWVSRFAPT
ncbi:radical SAM protein [Nonomuraea sp. NPDC052129]|uniref:radical SAM protein n=1 Tax=Nonomuraea sp. NPDC052129 TaxID=3154651 RepID=UPI00342839B1